MTARYSAGRSALHRAGRAPPSTSRMSNDTCQGMKGTYTYMQQTHGPVERRSCKCATLQPRTDVRHHKYGHTCQHVLQHIQSVTHFSLHYGLTFATPPCVMPVRALRASPEHVSAAYHLFPLIGSCMGAAVMGRGVTVLEVVCVGSLDMSKRCSESCVLVRVSSEVDSCGHRHICTDTYLDMRIDHVLMVGHNPRAHCDGSKR